MTTMFQGWCQALDGITFDGIRQDCHGDPVARQTHHHGGTTTLCQQHLDTWLDNADNDPSLEPAALTWL